MVKNSAIDRQQLAKLLRAVINPEDVISDDETLKPYECDGLSMYTAMPLLVALPETVEQVQQIMQICYEHQVPVVARGAGTSLCAGAMPHEEGVVLSLAKFADILEIDQLARTARVQPLSLIHI